MDTLIAVPIILALTEAIKQAAQIERRFIPIMAIVIGLLIFALFNGVDQMNLFEGLLSGLTASGLYSGVKATVGDKKKAVK